MRKGKIGKSALSCLFVGMYVANANSAMVTLEGRTTITHARYHQTPTTGQEIDATDDHTSEDVLGRLSSFVNTGGSANNAYTNSEVSVNASGFLVDGYAKVGATSSHAYATAQSDVNLIFTTDAQTNVSIGIDKYNPGIYGNSVDPNQHSYIRLYQGNTLLADTSNPTWLRDQTTYLFPTLNLALNSGTYRIEGNFYAASTGYPGCFAYTSVCDTQSSMSLKFGANDTVSAVPIPAAAWLMTSGLAAIGATRRRRRSQNSL